MTDNGLPCIDLLEATPEILRGLMTELTEEDARWKPAPDRFSIAEVLAHLVLNIPDYYGDVTQRELAVELADYLAKRLEELRPEEATAARVLRELVKNQRLG